MRTIFLLVSSFFLPVLLRLRPERAHWLAMRVLRLWQGVRFRGTRTPLLRPPTFRVAQRVTVRNRIGLAAGFDKDAEAFGAFADLGFGFLELGTVTPLPQPGNDGVRLFRYPEREALVNRMGFNSGGADAFLRHVTALRPRVSPTVPLWINIGKNKATPNDRAVDDYKTLFQKLGPVADAFVVNVSSPNTPGLRDLQSEEFLLSIAAIAPKSVPVLVKFAPDLEDAQLRSLCEVIRSESRFAGAVVANTSRKLAEHLTGAKEGGLSGAPLFERSVQCVAIAREALGTEKLLVGVGGITNRISALRMRQAGADLIELYTGFVYRGPALVRELQRVPELSS